MIQQIELTYKTEGLGLYNLTQLINEALSQFNCVMGLCNIFLQHTSASLTITENADPDVLYDLEKFMEHTVPQNVSLYKHTAEGKDDMPAHIRSVLTTNSLSIPIKDTRLALGVWQGIFLWEHRIKSHERKILLSALT